MLQEFSNPNPTFEINLVTKEKEMKIIHEFLYKFNYDELEIIHKCKGKIMGLNESL